MAGGQLPVATPPEQGVPATSGHQDTLDGVRAIAALLVLVFHVASNTGTIGSGVSGGWLLNGGQVGVAVFFTLSGLLLYRPWARAALDAGRAPGTLRYLRHRALRILPAYWALVVCVLVVSEHEHLSDGLTWVKLLTLTQIYDPNPWWNTGLGPRQMGQAWSLAVEAAWYLTLPLTAALLGWWARRRPDPGARARRLLRGLAGYAALSFVFTIVMFTPRQHVRLGTWLPRYFAWFAVGMALAVVAAWARRPDSPAAVLCRTVARSWGSCWLIALFLTVISASPITGPQDLFTPDTFWTSEFHLLLYGLAAAFFVLPVALAPPGHPALGAILGNRVMRFLGRISYGMFLWQLVIVLNWFDGTDRLFNGDLLVDLPILTALTVLAGTVSYYVVEAAFQRLSRRGDAT